MVRSRRTKTLMVFLMALLLFPALGSRCFAASPEDDLVPKIRVSGEATLELPADQLQLSVSVVTENEDAKAAMDENSRRVSRVIEALKKNGLGEKEYQTGRFAISPRYSQRPRDAREDWTPRIVGYRVENMLQIRTKKLELIGDLIRDAVDAGANSIPSIGFGLSDPRSRREDAIRQATENAMADAVALAEAAGVRLAGVLSMELDEFPVVAPQPLHAARMMEFDKAAVPPIQPGDVTVRARVSMVYGIE